MRTLRRWVNSPSIDPEKTKIILSEQGEESVEMTVSPLPQEVYCLCTRRLEAESGWFDRRSG